MLNDTRIIGRLGAHDITAQRYELQLLDGSLRWLHDVRRHLEEPELYLRAVHRSGGVYTLVDLRKLAPSLAESLPFAPAIDRPGLVYYTLRHRFPGALQFDLALREVQALHGSAQPLEVAA
jgi:hypothetical protein